MCRSCRRAAPPGTCSGNTEELTSHRPRATVGQLGASRREKPSQEVPVTGNPGLSWPGIWMWAPELTCQAGASRQLQRFFVSEASAVTVSRPSPQLMVSFSPWSETLRLGPLPLRSAADLDG